MSRNGSYIKSMNGIVSFDDGDGTTIEGSQIDTDTINCNTLTANSIIYTDFIDSNANTYIQCLSDITFNGVVNASFVPTSNNQLCNKLYVDTVASAGSSILPLTNVFTGTSNTFNNSLITNNIVQRSSGSSNINFYNTLSTNSIINMFSDTTNTYNGVINICSGVGVQVPTMNIMVGDPNTFYGYKTLKIGDQYTRITLNSSIDISTDNITAVDNTTSKNIFKFNTGDITIGKTGKINLGEDISIKQKTIASTGTTDIINLFNNISGSIGQINMAGKFVIKELSIASTSITDNVSLFNNLSGSFGVVKMATNLLFKQSNILSSAVGDVINLFTNLTTGTLNIGTEITTGTLNLATGVMTGILNIGTGITTGNLYIGSGMTTGDITIGNTTSITNGAQGNIIMGNGDNASNTADNGRVTINKLRVGPGSSYRCMILGRNIGAGAVGQQSYTIPSAPTTFGNPLVFAMLNSGTAAFGNPNTIYGVMINITGSNTFNYKKVYNGGTADGESFNYMAIWI